MAASERIAGPDHPDMLTPLGNLGRLLAETKRYRRAIAVAERAARVSVAAFGDVSLAHADQLENLSQVYLAAGDAERALGAISGALALRRRLAPDDHVALGQTVWLVAICLSRTGRRDEAAARYREAYAVIPDDDSNHAGVLIDLAGEEGFSGNWRAACADYERAARTVVELGRDDTAYLMTYVYTGLAECRLETGAAARAIDLADRALALADASHAGDDVRGRLEVERGRALWASGRDRRGGLALVRRGRDRLAALPSTPRDLERANAWLRRHDPAGRR